MSKTLNRKDHFGEVFGMEGPILGNVRFSQNGMLYDSQGDYVCHENGNIDKSLLPGSKPLSEVQMAEVVAIQGMTITELGDSITNLSGELLIGALEAEKASKKPRQGFIDMIEGELNSEARTGGGPTVVTPESEPDIETPSILA